MALCSTSPWSNLVKTSETLCTPAVCVTWNLSGLLRTTHRAVVKTMHVKLNSLFDNDRLQSENEVSFLIPLCRRRAVFAFPFGSRGNHIEYVHGCVWGVLWNRMVTEQQANGSSTYFPEAESKLKRYLKSSGQFQGNWNSKVNSFLWLYYGIWKRGQTLETLNVGLQFEKWWNDIFQQSVNNINVPRSLLHVCVRARVGSVLFIMQHVWFWLFLTFVSWIRI